MFQFIKKQLIGFFLVIRNKFSVQKKPIEQSFEIIVSPIIDNNVQKKVKKSIKTILYDLGINDSEIDDWEICFDSEEAYHYRLLELQNVIDLLDKKGKKSPEQIEQEKRAMEEKEIEEIALKYFEMLKKIRQEEEENNSYYP